MTHTKREAFRCWESVEKDEKNNEGVIKGKVYFCKGIKPRKEKRYFKLREVMGYPVETEAAFLFMTYENGVWWAFDFDSGLSVYANPHATKDEFYDLLQSRFSHKDGFLGCSTIDFEKTRKTLGKKLYPINKEETNNEA